MTRMLRTLFRNRKGATAIEYGLIVALISLSAAAAWTSVGGGLRTLFTTVSTDLTPTNGT